MKYGPGKLRKQPHKCAKHPSSSFSYKGQIIYKIEVQEK